MSGPRVAGGRLVELCLLAYPARFRSRLGGSMRDDALQALGRRGVVGG